MKKLIIGESGTGKSKLCFDLASKYDGTVVYLSNVNDANKHYEKFDALNCFTVYKFTKNFNFKAGEKYFIFPNKRGEAVLKDLVPLLGLDTDYCSKPNLSDKLLLIVDDGTWETCDNKTLLLWKLIHSDTDVVITAFDWKYLLDDENITEAMKNDVKRYWEVSEL